MTQEEGGCSVIVRLDHDTLDLLGYHADCAPYVDTFLDEDGARALTDCCSEGGMRLNSEDEEYLWVFHVPPGDFGDVAVVTDHIVQRAATDGCPALSPVGWRLQSSHGGVRGHRRRRRLIH